MFVLFADEFGHEAAYSSNGDNSSYNPVFGYGGFVIPAANLDRFATHFFDFKTSAARRKRLNLPARSPADLRLKAYLQTLDGVRDDVAARDPQLRKLTAKLEVKGEDVFPPGYARRLIRRMECRDPKSGEKYRSFFNYMKGFLRLIRRYDGQIFFVGVEKQLYENKPFDKPHVRFLDDLLVQAYRLAIRERSTITIFLDHHQSDVREADGWFRHGPRAQRSRQVIMERRLFERITEPVVSLNSKESQCIQAADWICYLLSQTLPVYCGKQVWDKYRLLHDEIENFLFEGVCEVSKFKTVGATFYGKNLQHKLQLRMPPVYEERGDRPYYKTN